jgi:serine racemase
MERAKLVIEPSAAVGIAALGTEDFRRHEFQRIGVVLCGGNLDLDALPSLL